MLACFVTAGLFPIGVAPASEPGDDFAVIRGSDSVELRAGALKRFISLKDRNVTTTRLLIDGLDALAAPTAEFSFTVSFAEPNESPRGLQPGPGPAIKTTAFISADADSARIGGLDQTNVQWLAPVRVSANAWAASMMDLRARTIRPSADRQQLILQADSARDSGVAGLRVELTYEIYDGFPVMRKWVTIENRGLRWLKLDQLTVEDVTLAADCRRQTPLTPAEQGAGPSVIAFAHETAGHGLIAVSEIPSALRHTRDTGAMGYADAHFEWVLGPGEQFVTEPVFLFAFSGAAVPTVSGVSTPLDRAVEGPYLDFLRRHVGVAADARPIPAPQWCSWSNFGPDLNDAIVREQAGLAARCGFGLVLLDQGWQNGLVGTEPDPRKFPDFADTCRHVRAQGLELGLWVSCYRSADSADLRTLPAARSVPWLERDGGFGMSFASAWRDFFADNLAAVGRQYGVTYFKQDFTNLKFGDIAAGHESRTRKESLLRGLRGLLAAQDRLRRNAPHVTSQLTHEIYWGTPGVPCDVAALKHAAAYHIPPNDYSGVGRHKQRIRDNWPLDPLTLRAQLVAGAFNARQRFHAHRGLPLYALEYYAAHAVNVRGSLTPAVQDRQICSWLAGAPATFAGDLAALTDEHLAHYRRRFDLLRRLERDHGIYRHYQFSGVPGPTDTDWHWWGKLNARGAGVLVVLRGKAGADERAVNIPWVAADRTYQAIARLAEKPLGRFRGAELQAGALKLTLPPLGQELVELTPVINTAP